MWVWVIDQLWIFLCIGIAGGIWGAVYQLRRTQIDVETSPIGTFLRTPNMFTQRDWLGTNLVGLFPPESEVSKEAPAHFGTCRPGLRQAARR
jgi:hypothetical protein